MMDVLLNKTNVIKRCIQRIHEVYQDDDTNLEDFTKQDSIILNIQRCCEACIDIAMHLVSERNLGVPQNSRDAFNLLEQNQIILPETAMRLKAMVGFRNIAVHDYQSIQIEIVKNIITFHLDELLKFAEELSING